MWRLTLVNLAAGRGRLLPALSVVLGVGFLMGTLVLTDTMRQAAIERQAQSATSIDAIITPATGSGGLPVVLLDDVRGASGVAAAEGWIWTPITVVGPDGDVLTSGRPGVLIGVPQIAELRDVEARAGVLPPAPGEIVVDYRSAAALGVATGQRLSLPDPRDGQEHHSRTYRVSGLIDLGNARDRFEGALVVGLPTPAVVGLVDATSFGRIDVLAEPGVPQPELERALTAQIGDGFRVQTGDELRQQMFATALAGLDTFRYLLWAFAGVALAVAALIIVTTFSITFARRTREIALVRCLGGHRRQVLATGLAEATLLGLVASLVGVGVGVAGGAAAVAFVGGSDDAADPAATALQVEPRAILAALIVGVIVTSLAGLLPALRASRTAPMAALRRAALDTPTGRGWRRAGIAVIATVPGVSLLVTGAVVRQPGEDASAALLVSSAGFLLLVLAALVSTPLYVPRLSALAGGAAGRVLGLPVMLAGANAVRAPRRTAVTAAGVIIGLTLMTLLSTVTTSYAQTVRHGVTTSAPFAYTLHASANSTIPADLVTELGRAPSVAGTVSLRSAGSAADVVVSGQTVRARGVGAPVRRLAPGAVVEGSLRSFRPGTVALRRDLAGRLGVGVGDTVRLPTGPGGGLAEYHVVALLGSASPFGPIAMSTQDFQRLVPDAQIRTLLVSPASDATADEMRMAVEEALADYPFVTAVSSEEHLAQFTASLATLQNLLSGLLALAVLIAFLGVINTLSLSIIERTRESALLRALGLTRSGLRWMLSAESTLVTVVGTGMGILLGLAGGWAIASAMPGEGAALVEVPVARLACFVAGAVVMGLLAGLLPGNRAVRDPVAAALQEG